MGKSSTCVNLAYASAKSGLKTLLIDLDQQGAASFYFDLDSNKHLPIKRLGSGKLKSSAIKASGYAKLDVLPAYDNYRQMDVILDDMKRSKTRLAEFVDSVSEGYQRVYLDCPPSLSLVAENVFRAADFLLVPVIPTPLSIRTFEQLWRHFEDSELKRKKLRPFFSMVDSRKRIHGDTIALMRAEVKRVLFNHIPQSAVVEGMGLKQAPLLSYSDRHPVSVAYRALWQEVEDL